MGGYGWSEITHMTNLYYDRQPTNLTDQTNPTNQTDPTVSTR